MMCLVRTQPVLLQQRTCLPQGRRKCIGYKTLSLKC